MRATWTIFKREVHGFFLSPLAYVVLSAWTIWCGATFWLLMANAATMPASSSQSGPLPMFFGGTTLFYIPLLAFVPAFTMRMVAEERSRGTLETLLTAPVTEASVVLGKYFAGLLFWIVLWVPTGFYVYLASRYGDIDPGAVAASYVGVVGVGAFYIAIGLLMSTLAPNQLISAVLTFVVLGGLFLLGLGQFIFTDDAHREFYAYVSLWGHMEAFSRGVIDTRYLAFDLSLATLAIALAVGVLKVRRTEG